jgi:hypothetical protein
MRVRRFVARAAVVALVLFVADILVSRSRSYTADVTVINGSSKDIDSVVVQMSREGGRVIRVEKLKIGSSSSGCLNIHGVQGFRVDVEFAGGDQLQDEVGYVEGGSDQAYTLQIFDDRVEIAEKVILPTPYLNFHRCEKRQS